MDQDFKSNEAVAIHGWAMESETIQKNGRISEGHTIRRNILELVCPYKAKMWIVTAAAAAVPFLICCKKEDPIDPYAEQKKECAVKAGDYYWDDGQKICISPTAERIKELTPLEKKLAGEVRAAVKPALTQPEDLQEWYWDMFNYLNVPKATNLLDSVNLYIVTIDNMYNSYGKPLPTKNDANFAKLYEKCKTYVPIATELKDLLQK